MSGHQSTSLALLDADRTGVVLSSIHHRDQARLYGKQVVDGRGEHQLSPEEDEAIRLALAGERGTDACSRTDARRATSGPRGRSHEALLAAGRGRRARRAARRSRDACSRRRRTGAVDRGARADRELAARAPSARRSTRSSFDAPDVRDRRRARPPRHATASSPREPIAPDEVAHGASRTRRRSAQCARFLRRAAARRAAVVGRASTAEAVRAVAEGGARPAPRRTRRSARGTPPRSTARSCSPRAIEDDAEQRDALRVARARRTRARRRRRGRVRRPSLVFWGAGDRAPGLARALPVGVRLRAA